MPKAKAKNKKTTLWMHVVSGKFHMPSPYYADFTECGTRTTNMRERRLKWKNAIKANRCMKCEW